MDETQVKHVIEAALLAAGRPLPLETLVSLFATKASELDRETLKRALDALAEDYRERGLELKEVASGYRIQVRSSMTDWLTPLWEERAPRYTRALLETLALIAYRQPITRAEIEEVRGVAVSTNIIRTLIERNWIRVVGHRDVPGKPAMFGTTKDFLDYFGLKKLEDLPTLADIKDGLPQLHPQADFIEAIEGGTGDDGEPGASEGAAAHEGTVADARVGAETYDGTAADASERAATEMIEGAEAGAVESAEAGAIEAEAGDDEDGEPTETEGEASLGSAAAETGDDGEDSDSADFVVVDALATYVEELVYLNNPTTDEGTEVGAGSEEETGVTAESAEAQADGESESVVQRESEAAAEASPTRNRTVRDDEDEKASDETLSRVEAG